MGQSADLLPTLAWSLSSDDASRRSVGADPPPAGEGKDHPITQLEWARKGVITKEMIYIAERENLGRKTMLDVAQEARDDGASFGASVNSRLANPTTCSSRPISSAAMLMKLTICPTDARPTSLR